jgi:hypothetical protein
MFDADDPALRRVREIAFRFPGASEKISHGRPAFYTTKVFVYFGGSIKIDSEWVQHDQSVMVQPDESDRRALLDDERTFVPAYLGPSGWLGIDLPPASSDDGWDEIAELIDASYRLTAGKRLIAELDAR